MAITRAYKNATNFQERKTATPLIINGDMQIAQRGTSITGITSGNTYGLDRQVLTISGLGTWTMSQESDAPTGQGFSKSLKLDCTTAQASPTTSNNLRLNYRLEGQDLQLLKKGTSNAEAVTISFWVKSAKTGTYILELFDNDNTRQISQAYTINSANTWEKKVLSFAGDTTGALDNDNELSLYLFFWLGAGSNFTSGTLNTSWASNTNANRVVGQVNLADSTSNDWYITGVQLEVGTFDVNSIPPFQFEDRTTSLARCQRYYFKTFAQSTTPAQNIDTDNVVLSFAIGGDTASYGSYQFPVTMRTSGTLTTFNPYASNANLRKPNSSTDIATDTVTTNEANMYIGVINATTSLHLHFTVDAEL